MSVCECTLFPSVNYLWTSQKWHFLQSCKRGWRNSVHWWSSDWESYQTPVFGTNDDQLNGNLILNMLEKRWLKIFIFWAMSEIYDYMAMHISYFSLIFPCLSYCAEVWGNTYASNIKPLYLIQKKVVRMVRNVKYREHTSNLFIKSNLLKLEDLVKNINHVQGKK